MFVIHTVLVHLVPSVRVPLRLRVYDRSLSQPLPASSRLVDKRLGNLEIHRVGWLVNLYFRFGSPNI